MRTHLLLAGLVALVVALAPRASQADNAPPIFVDFPELSEWGHLVIIGGVEYWRPYPDLTPNDWAPYANGYLYEDPEAGLVWVSNDPWGVITEHYGYWRHHDRYGYVWRPLYPLEWQPVMSSIFRDETNYIVGWTPFYIDVWNRGLYVVGWGFDDYYWAPFWNRVCYPDFYYYHSNRFYGWHVGVVFYDYDVYYRHEPDYCYRRDYDYRERRGHHRRERHEPDSSLRDLVVRSDLKSKRQTDNPQRLLEDAAPVRARSTVSITPRSGSGSPWSAPQVDKKREERVEQTRAGFQRSSVSVVKDGQQSRNASQVSRPARASEQTPVRVVEPERRSQRSAAETTVRRQIESRKSDLKARSERAAERASESEERSERPARVIERAAPSREAARPERSEASASRTERRSEPAPRVERRSEPAPRVERQAAPARAEGQSGSADRVRGAFNGRKGRN